MAAALGSGYLLYDALTGDKPDGEKSADVGGALGNIGGSLAGAAAGAALGSVVPIIGTAIGGLLGGALGGLGGDALGRFTGQQFAGGSGAGSGSGGGGRMGYRRPGGGRRGPAADQQGANWGERLDQANEWYDRGSTAVENAGSIMDALGISVGDSDKDASAAADEKPQGAVTFSPTVNVTVQGDVKDPRQLAGELMPHLRTLFDQFQAQTARGSMYDPAHAT